MLTAAPVHTALTANNTARCLMRMMTLWCACFLSVFLVTSRRDFGMSNTKLVSDVQQDLVRPTQHLFCVSGTASAALTHPPPLPLKNGCVDSGVKNEITQHCTHCSSSRLTLSAHCRGLRRGSLRHSSRRQPSSVQSRLT